MGLTAPQTMPHRHPIAIGAVVTVLLTGLQLPLAAGTPPKAKASEHPHERFDPLHRHRLRGGDPKVKFGKGDAWVAKYKVGPNGATQVLWTKQLGTSEYDASRGVATDSQGNVFISGFTRGALAGSNKGLVDTWVAKYSPEGTLLWKKQLGTSEYDYSFGVATNSQGNVFISGYTGGAIAGSNKGVSDAWVAKYSPEGTLLWTKQLGTSYFDYSFGVATDSQGNVFISGATYGALAGSNKEYNDPDAWVAKYSPNGKLLWLRQEGTTRRSDYASDVATDNNGHVLVTGYTYSSLGD